MEEIRTRSDCNLLARAANERWPMQDKWREGAIKELFFILLSKESSNRTKISAAKALAAFDRLNIQAAPPVRQSVNINLAVEERRKQLLERIEKLRGSDDSTDDE